MEWVKFTKFGPETSRLQYETKCPWNHSKNLRNFLEGQKELSTNLVDYTLG